MTGILNCALVMVTLYGWSQNAVSLLTKIQTEMVESSGGDGGKRGSNGSRSGRTSCSSSRLSSQATL